MSKMTSWDFMIVWFQWQKNKWVISIATDIAKCTMIMLKCLILLSQNMRLWYRLINSLRLSDTYMYMRHQPRPSLVQIMACHLFGAKPLSEPMLYYCQLDSLEQTSVKLYSKFKHFHSRKCIWKCCLEMSAILTCPQSFKTHSGKNWPKTSHLI